MSTVNLNHLCMGCFSQLSTAGIVCPICGYDPGMPPDALYRLQPRTILSGKYMIGKVLGEGGFGITYIGYDLNLDAKVALKEYYPTGLVMRSTTVSMTVQPAGGEHGEHFIKGRERFVDEAKRLARFRTLPGIVMVNDFFVENGTAYIVMEYIEGQTLKSYLAQMGGKLPAAQVLEMMKPVFASLSHVHQHGIIHRDISPDNIMITRDGSVKLLDFGAAREFGEDGDKSLSVMLKHGYAPAEQYTSKGRQGPHTDVYSLAATIYKAITGMTPENSMDRMMEDTLEPPSKLGVNLPYHQEAALMKGLAVRRENRCQTVSELYDALQIGTQQIETLMTPSPADAMSHAAPQPVGQPPPPAGGTPFVREGGRVGAYANVPPQPVGQPPPPADGTPFAYEGGIGDAHVDVQQSPDIPQQTAPFAHEGGAAKRRGLSSNASNKNKIVAAIVAACLVIVIALALTLPGLQDGGGDDTRTAGTPGDGGNAQNGGISGDGGNTPPGGSSAATSSNHNVLAAGGFRIWRSESEYEDIPIDVSEWRDIIDVAVGHSFAAGLKSDGTVVAAGSEFWRNAVSDWRDITQLSAGYPHLVGLKSDGTVVATGSNHYGEADVSDWRDIAEVHAGQFLTVGVKTDGTVVAVGGEGGTPDVSGWSDILAVTAYYDIYGLKSDGMVVSTYYDPDWRDIIALEGNFYTVVGLKADGTVRSGVGVINSGIYFDLEDTDTWENTWDNIVALSSGQQLIVGLKSDGTVVAWGGYWGDVVWRGGSQWQDIVEVSVGEYHIVGLKSDGTVVASMPDDVHGAFENRSPPNMSVHILDGYADLGQFDVSDWQNVTAVYAGPTYTIAITSDGAGEAEPDSTAEITQDIPEVTTAMDRGLSAIFPVLLEDENADIRTLKSFSYCFINFHSNWEGDTQLTADEIRDVTVYVDGVPNTVSFSGLWDARMTQGYIDAGIVRVWRITLDTEFTQAPATYQFSLNVKGIEITVDEIPARRVNADRTLS